MAGRARGRSLRARVGAVVAVALGAALPLLAARAGAGRSGRPGHRLRGGDGRVTIDSGTQQTLFFAEDIEVLPGGRTIAYGSFPLPGSGSSGILAFTAAGVIDSTWNGGVPIPWNSSFQIPQRTLVVDAAGRVLAREGTAIARFTATGAPDATWGGDGRVDLNELFSGGLGSLRIDDLEVEGNKVVVGGTRRESGSNHVFFARLTDTGGADSTFAGGGYRQLPNQLDTPGATPAEFSGDLERDASGNLYLTAGDFVGKYYVVKATPTGAIDTTFSGDGVAPMPGTAFDMVLDTSGRPVTYSPNLASTDDGHAWELTCLTTSGAAGRDLRRRRRRPRPGARRHRHPLRRGHGGEHRLLPDLPVPRRRRVHPRRGGARRRRGRPGRRVHG